MELDQLHILYQQVISRLALVCHVLMPLSWRKHQVRPQMEYGAVMRDPIQEKMKDELEKVQHRAARLPV